jgi:hypothetical protein
MPEDLEGIALVGYRGRSDPMDAPAWILHEELREALRPTRVDSRERIES